MNYLFFELIQLSIGTRESLYHTPSKEEWRELYDMAHKQALTGICFNALQRMGGNSEDGWKELGIPEMMYLKWMAKAAVIRKRNEVVNKQCADVQDNLLKDGIKSCILKGQGVGSLYKLRDGRGELREEATDLSMLRQSGDIDIWVEGGMKSALSYLKKTYGQVEYDYINAHVPMYEDTEVELHWRAQSLTNLIQNVRLQKWLEKEDVQKEMLGGNADLYIGNEHHKITTPTLRFNAFYILLHCYHHMFESGLGLRQLMDYYFVLCNILQRDENLDACGVMIRKYGMKRFASGVLWMMKPVFGMDDSSLTTLTSKLGITASEEEGRFLLDEVMHNGNFGHHDERINKVGSGKMSELWSNIQHNWHLASHYPTELFWQPVWLIYHFLWKRIWKMRHKELFR